jgi:hypothetical protein
VLSSPLSLDTIGVLTAMGRSSSFRPVSGPDQARSYDATPLVGGVKCHHLDAAEAMFNSAGNR